MAEVDILPDELRELIGPHLREILLSDYGEITDEIIEDMFNEVVFTYPDGMHLVTLNPCGELPAPQFNVYTGEFVELTNWDYIQTVDVEAQILENEHRELIEKVSGVLNHYLSNEYKILSNYEIIIDNRREITVHGETIYAYDCPCQTIYLDENLYAVTYDRQKVEDDKYYYNFTSIESNPNMKDIYTYIAPYEWKRSTSGGGGVIG